MKINLDSPIINILSRAWDVLAASVLFVLTCLPIFTIGAACTAMHSTIMAICNDSCTGVLSRYFGAFKENFKQSTLIWLGFIGVLALLILDILACVIYPKQDAFYSIMRGITIFFGAFYLLMVNYVYAIIARYMVTWKQALRNAVYLITKYPLTAFLILTLTLIHFLCYFLVLLLALPVTPILLFFQEALLNRIINKEQGVVKEKKRKKSDFETYDD